MTVPHPHQVTNPDMLYARFRALGLAFTVHEHPPVFTVEKAQSHRGVDGGVMPGAHCKSLFLRDKKGVLWLVVCLEDRRIDMKALSGLLGSARLSFGRPELLAERLGIEPGSVTPFAVINDVAENGDDAVRVILDAEMMQTEPVNYHPLINTATVAMTPAGLVQFLEACDHAPATTDLTDATAV
jgi:Ala-tRNA(Pro) deacylase